MWLGIALICGADSRSERAIRSQQDLVLRPTDVRRAGEGLWAGAGAGAVTCLPYLKYMRPLFPTLATANCLPSRPAEPPSGAISHLSSSWLAFLGRRAARISSCDLRSVTGSRGFVFPKPRLGAPRPVVFARLPSAPSRGGG